MLGKSGHSEDTVAKYSQSLHASEKAYYVLFIHACVCACCVFVHVLDEAGITGQLQNKGLVISSV